MALPSPWLRAGIQWAETLPSWKSIKRIHPPSVTALGSPAEEGSRSRPDTPRPILRLQAGPACLTENGLRSFTGPFRCMPVSFLLLFVAAILLKPSAMKKHATGSTAIDFRSLREMERKKMMEAMSIKAENHKAHPPILGEKRRLRLEDFAASEGGIGGIYIVPGWLNDEEAANLTKAIDSSPESTWVSLTRRRLQNLGGVPHMDGMRPLPLPYYATEVMRALTEAGVFGADNPPNHILLNEYRDGQGISAHKDGPLYHPLVAVLSLGDSATIHFTTRPGGCDPPVSSVELGHGSLLVFTGEAYERYWHCIPARTHARTGERRLSLTVRHVLRVEEEGREVLETAERRVEEERRERRFLHSITDNRPDLDDDGGPPKAAPRGPQ